MGDTIHRLRAAIAAVSAHVFDVRELSDSAVRIELNRQDAIVLATVIEDFLR